MDGSHVHRLPEHLVPSHYDVSLVPVLEDEFISYGQVSFDVKYSEANAPSNAYKSMIVLHAKNLHLDLDSVTVKQGTDTIAVSGYEFDLEREFLTLTLDGQMTDQAVYTVSMSFQSNLAVGDLRGFYTSTYHDEASGTDKVLAVTQFEAIDARRAFPCMDEPNLKATFTVQLGRQAHMLAASNMPKVDTTEIEDMDGYVLDTFQESVEMSTYLVAFFIGEYERTLANTSGLLNGTSNSQWEFGVLHQPSQANETKLALDSGAIMLAGLEDYYQIPYPLPKMDQVAIPDFYYGGMENWGLITYAERYLNFVEGDSSSFDAYSLLGVIGHELAHQWFGDLVTMDWWDDLWLNEGETTKVQNIT